MRGGGFLTSASNVEQKLLIGANSLTISWVKGGWGLSRGHCEAETYSIRAVFDVACNGEFLRAKFRCLKNDPLNCDVPRSL